MTPTSFHSVDGRAISLWTQIYKNPSGDGPDLYQIIEHHHSILRSSFLGVWMNPDPLSQIRLNIHLHPKGELGVAPSTRKD